MANKMVDGVLVALSPAEEASLAIEVAKLPGKRKARLWEAIKEERARRRVEGGVLLASENKWFHTDDDSRLQYLMLDATGASIPVGATWKTMDGPVVNMTRSKVNELILAIANQDQELYTVAKQARATMEADPGKWDINSIVWPATFPG